MREILFRGKRNDNGEWEYGNLICSKNYAIGSQKFPLQKPVVVDSATVGQYTGLTDKNGNRIFEGDIIKVDSAWTSGNYAVEFDEGGFCAGRNFMQSWLMCGDFYGDVIGNIYDNPELLWDAAHA